MARGKKIKSVPWKRIPENAQETIREFSHFTAKAANSNSSPFGIRLSPEDRLDLPYVAVRTLDIGKIPVDYFQGATTMALIRRMLWVMNNMEGHETREEFTDVDEGDVEAISRAIPDLAHRYASPKDFVGLRLRQIIVQKETGEDVVLTPLPSPGFSAVLKERLDEEKREPGKPLRRPKGFLGIGGSNTQNVGRYVSSMQTVLFFSPPKDDPTIRTYYAIRNSASEDLSLSTKILGEFYEWRRKTLEYNRGIMPGDSDHREKERGFIFRIVDDLKREAVDLSEIVDHVEEEKKRPILPIKKDPWLDPSLRTRDWARKEAKKIYNALLGARIFDGKGLVDLGIGEQDSLRWIGFIEEALL